MIGSHHRRNSIKTGSYATDDDFQQLFKTQFNDFFRLALRLTTDAEKTEHCLILAEENCLSTNTICKDFVHVWARRMVIRNAIDLVLDTDCDSAGNEGSEFHLLSGEIHKGDRLESVAILHLPKFDRLAFVICALERLSIQDCALLLRRAPKDVNEAIARAASRIELQPLWVKRTA
jgi:DNA-directed RNA polymerase specialized sigma24 family protein